MYVKLLRQYRAQKETARLQHGFRLAHMVQFLPEKKKEKAFYFIQWYAQKALKKIPEPTGEILADVKYFLDMHSFFDVCDSVMHLFEKERKLKISDTYKVRKLLAQKVSLGILSYAKMKPENKEKFEQIAFSKPIKKSKVIFSTMRQKGMV